MSKLKLDNYDDYDYDDNFAYDYDQEYDDYEAFKQVQDEEVVDDYSNEVNDIKRANKSSSNEYYEKLKEQINKEVEEIDDKKSYSSKKSYDGDTSIFGTLFNIIIWACIAVAVVLFIYFIITRQIVIAFLYVIGLIVAFLFGYGLMYFFDNFLISKD